MKCYEAPVVEVSKLVEESALKQVMVAKSENNNFHTVKNVIISLLQQVVVNLEKEDCEQCVNNIFIFCDDNTQYKSVFNLRN